MSSLFGLISFFSISMIGSIPTCRRLHVFPPVLHKFLIKAGMNIVGFPENDDISPVHLKGFYWG